MRLADQFASAAVDGSLWMPALVNLAEATGSARGQLIGIGNSAAVPFNWVNDFSDEGLADFVEIEGGSPMVNPRIAVSAGASLLVVHGEADYDAAVAALPTDIYRAFASDHDIPYGCQSKLIEDGHGIVGLAVLRTERDGRTTPEQRRLFGQVAPYVRSAVRMQMALEEAGADLVMGTVELVGGAVFVCTEDGRIAAMSPSAERLLASGRMRIKGNRLEAGNHRDTVALRAAMAQQEHVAGAVFRSLALAGEPGQLPLVIDVCRAPMAPWRFNFTPRLIVIVRSGRRWHDEREKILRQLYNLSAAEADVAVRLARGERRQAIAEARQTSVETVQAQLKAIFAKLGISREVELVSMLGDLLRI